VIRFQVRWFQYSDRFPLELLFSPRRFSTRVAVPLAWLPKLDLLDAPDQANRPGFFGGEIEFPDGHDLRALVNALEAFFGF
jgi:hypothetical protein